MTVTIKNNFLLHSAKSALHHKGRKLKMTKSVGWQADVHKSKWHPPDRNTLADTHTGSQAQPTRSHTESQTFSTFPPRSLKNWAPFAKCKEGREMVGRVKQWKTELACPPDGSSICICMLCKKLHSKKLTHHKSCTSILKRSHARGAAPIKMQKTHQHSSPRTHSRSSLIETAFKIF